MTEFRRHPAGPFSIFLKLPFAFMRRLLMRGPFGIVAACCLQLLTACGGGDGPAAADQGVTPGSAAEAESAGLARHFYWVKGGGLWAVEPGDPAHPVLIDAGRTEIHWTVPEGRWDADRERILDPRLKTLFYRKPGGRFYRISARPSEPPRPVQVSSMADPSMVPGEICAYTHNVAPDFADHRRSAYVFQYGVYTDSGACLVDPDWRQVRLGMSAQEDPVMTELSGTWVFVGSSHISDNVFPVWDRETGAVSGWLGANEKELVHCDADFTGCLPVKPFLFTAYPFSMVAYERYYFASSGQVILNIDHSLYAYDTATRRLSGSLHNLGTEFPFYLDFDATHFYFLQGRTIYRLARDGRTSSSPLVSEPDRILESWETARSIVYIVLRQDPSPAYAMKAVAKDGEAPRVLIDFAAEALTIQETAGEWIYYVRGTTPGVIRESGADRSEWPDARWAGRVETADGALNLMRMDGCAPTSCAGATLKTFDARTNGPETPLGSLPPDVGGLFFYGIGKDTLGIGRSGANMTTEVFYARLDRSQSLVRVTHTPVDEELILEHMP